MKDISAMLGMSVRAVERRMATFGNIIYSVL